MIDKIKAYYDIPTLCQVTHPGMFQRSLWSYGKVWHKFNKDEKIKQQVYYPFVVYNSFLPKGGVRGIIKQLEVDVSLPKVVYGNNLYELDNRDWNTVCRALSSKLQAMGIHINPQDVGLGTVQQVEYSKNILTGKVPVPYILEELYQAKPMNNYMDIQKVSYRNGESLYFYCGSYDVLFYDKGAEILGQIQGNTFPAPLVQKLRNGAYNILRMEVRFHDRKTLMDFLHTHGFSNNHGLLQDVYSKHISQQVLTHYWNALSQTTRRNSPFVFSPGFELLKIWQGGGQNLTTQQALAKLGARLLLREYGYKGARNALKCIGCSNPAQILRKYVSCVFKPFWKLDIWKFIDVALSRFSLLGPNRWRNLKTRASAPWFHKQEPLLKLKEVAQWLNVSVRVIRKEIKALRLVAHKIGGCYRVARYDVLEYMNA